MGTMPWHETEALFRSTTKAATEHPNLGDGAQDLNIIDLGEAGRQEIWHCGACSITKTVAKHGGELVEFPSIRLLMERVASLSLHQLSHMFVDQRQTLPSNSLITPSTLIRKRSRKMTSSG